MTRRVLTLEEAHLIRSLRAVHKPEEIALIVGRTKTSIDSFLSKQRAKGFTFPKLRHARLKYDLAKATEFRVSIKSGMKYKDIGIHPSIISRTLAAEIRGELRW